LCVHRPGGHANDLPIYETVQTTQYYEAYAILLMCAAWIMSPLRQYRISKKGRKLLSEIQKKRSLLTKATGHPWKQAQVEPSCVSVSSIHSSLLYIISYLYIYDHVL
jgi:hypothetical protein